MQKYLYLLFGVTLLGAACSTPKTVSNTKNPSSIPDAAYYDQLSNNHERIIKLLTGKYSYYEGDTLVAVNEELDSMVLYIAAVGQPSRDGYWIYSEQYLTSLPDDPILQSLQLIERISRDTFQGSSYTLIAKGKETYKGLAKTPDAAALKETPKELINLESGNECPILYIKQSNSNFLMQSDTCTGMADAGFEFMKLQGTVELAGQDASMVFLNANKDSFNITKAFFRRVPYEVPPKSKKK